MLGVYELTGAYRNFMDRLYDEGVDDTQILQACKNIEGAIEEKADGYARILKRIDRDIEAIKAEEKRLKARRAALENCQDRLIGNLCTSMKAAGKIEFKTGLFIFRIQKTPPGVKVENDKAFIQWCRENGRSEFLRTKEPEINRTALKNAILKGGEIIEGAKIVRGERLTIR